VLTDRATASWPKQSRAKRLFRSASGGIWGATLQADIQRMAPAQDSYVLTGADPAGDRLTDRPGSDDDSGLAHGGFLSCSGSWPLR
jgi:hypothetical protein